MSLYNKVIDLQKLSAAWQRVRRNKPAAGVDNLTWQQFDENSREELKQLQIELREHRYEPLPVRNVTLYKGEKARVIALYSMRDKVVQQSLASELTKLFDNRLSNQAYAYRSQKSALQAIEDITASIGTKQYSAVLKADITHFFDHISWNLLCLRLSRMIKEDNLLDLIRMNACTAMLDDISGELTEKTLGIHQGSGIAPILSNIYMMDFDIALTKPEFFYARYSDDILVLGADKQRLHTLANEIKVRLEELCLTLNESKTLCCSLDEGVDFLGYHLNSSGKSIPAKAEDRLYDRLETMWLTNPSLNVEEKAAKALEIIGGWQQYYREEREMQSIYEYVAFAFAVGGRKEMLPLLRQKRPALKNACRDITDYMSQLWKKTGSDELALLEYEQYYDLPSVVIRQYTAREIRESSNSRQSAGEGDEKSGQSLSNLTHRILLLYRKHFVYESEETSVELMQAYTDLQEYENARFWMEQTEQLKARKKQFVPSVHIPSYVSTTLPVQPDIPAIVRTSENSGTQLDLTERTLLLMLETFAGRDDIYSVENTSAGQHRKTELQERPLTEQQLIDHLQGKQTVGTYIQRPNATVHYIVWDIDISKQFLLKHGNRGLEFDTCLQKACQKAKEIQKLLTNKGMNSYIEFSGFRGYHVWLFLSEWIPVRFSNMLTDRIEEEIILDDDITIESFPNKVRLKAGRFGQVLKFPYGIHVRSGLRSYFIDDDGQPVTNIDDFVDTLASYSLLAIRKVLSYSMPSAQIIGRSASASNISDNKTESSKSDTTVLQTELLDSFGDITASIKEILLHCSLMQYLCLKSKRTGYLTHFERLSVLYVFGHVGEEGKEFVHEVMRHTMNYQYNVTQRFIDRIPEKPVSCLKLREQYRKISAEIGCSCNFKRMKNCYPSPVLHALSLSGDMQEKITVPTSRTLSAEKEQKVIDELNVHKKAQELAVKILELRKQQRSIERSVRKVERELEKIYDSVGADALEIEMGLLVRRRKENAYEWVIEI